MIWSWSKKPSHATVPLTSILLHQIKMSEYTVKKASTLLQVTLVYPYRLSLFIASGYLPSPFLHLILATILVF